MILLSIMLLLMTFNSTTRWCISYLYTTTVWWQADSEIRLTHTHTDVDITNYDMVANTVCKILMHLNLIFKSQIIS